MPKIELKNIELKYFGKTALRIDALEFDSCLGVIGPSGSGKTNFIKVLTGLEYIENGQILFDGKDITDIKTKQRGIVLLSAQTPLFVKKTVKYNLEYPLRQRKLKREDAAEKAVKSAEEFLLPLDTKIKDLTQEQRIDVLLARAFIRKPNLIIVDEPSCFAGNVCYFIIKLKQVLKTYQACAVLASYNFDMAKEICDKFIILNEGVVAAEGSRADIENSPDDYVRAGCGLAMVNRELLL